MLGWQWLIQSGLGTARQKLNATGNTTFRSGVSQTGRPLSPKNAPGGFKKYANDAKRATHGNKIPYNRRIHATAPREYCGTITRPTCQKEIGCGGGFEPLRLQGLNIGFDEVPRGHSVRVGDALCDICNGTKSK